MKKTIKDFLKTISEFFEFENRIIKFENKEIPFAHFQRWTRFVANIFLQICFDKSTSVGYYILLNADNQKNQSKKSNNLNLKRRRHCLITSITFVRKRPKTILTLSPKKIKRHL